MAITTYVYAMCLVLATNLLTGKFLYLSEKCIIFREWDIFKFKLIKLIKIILELFAV